MWILGRCTPSTSPLFSTSALARSKQVHINAIGSYTPSMHEFDLLPLLAPSASPSLGAVTVDSFSACQAEAGELVSATKVDSGLSWSQVLEIGALVDDAGAPDVKKVQGMERRGKGNVSLFKAVGIGAQDVVVAEVVVELAAKLGLGEEVGFF